MAEHVTASEAEAIRRRRVGEFTMFSIDVFCFLRLSLPFEVADHEVVEEQKEEGIREASPASCDDIGRGQGNVAVVAQGIFVRPS